MSSWTEAGTCRSGCSIQATGSGVTYCAPASGRGTKPGAGTPAHDWTAQTSYGSWPAATLAAAAR